MTDTDRARLAAILGMLGSAHAGERAAAALHAERFRKQHGLTWGEMLAAQPAPEPTEEVSEPEPEPPAWTPTPAKPEPAQPQWEAPAWTPAKPMPEQWGSLTLRFVIASAASMAILAAAWCLNI